MRASDRCCGGSAAAAVDHRAGPASLESSLAAAFLAAVANLACDAVLNFGTAARAWRHIAVSCTCGRWCRSSSLRAAVRSGRRFAGLRVREVLGRRDRRVPVPVVALQRVIHLYQEQREAARGLARRMRRLERANLSFASALVATLDARDRYTAGHSAAVAIYSRDIAKRLGLDEEQQQRCYVTGLVHDIGKIGLPRWTSREAGRTDAG